MQAWRKTTVVGADLVCWCFFLCLFQRRSGLVMFCTDSCPALRLLLWSDTLDAGCRHWCWMPLLMLVVACCCTLSIWANTAESPETWKRNQSLNRCISTLEREKSPSTWEKSRRGQSALSLSLYLYISVSSGLISDEENKGGGQDTWPHAIHIFHSGWKDSITPVLKTSGDPIEGYNWKN